jgi:hypothetical protein
MPRSLRRSHRIELLTSTNTVRHALLLVESDGLSAAILDHALGDGVTVLSSNAHAGLILGFAPQWLRW